MLKIMCTQNYKIISINVNTSIENNISECTFPNDYVGTQYIRTLGQKSNQKA